MSNVVERPCPLSDEIRETFDWDVTPATVAIIDALSTLTDEEPIDVFGNDGESLFDYVDPDALNNMFSHPAGDHITLDMNLGDYFVRINPGEIIARK